MIYIIGWAFSFLASITVGKSNYSRILEGAALVVFLLIVSFSRSGPDLVAYERAALGIIHLGETFGDIFEPGFYVTLQAAAIVTQSAVISVRVISALIVLLLALYWNKADSIEKKYLFYFFFPAALYSYSMNILGTGLAFVIFLLAWQQQRRGHVVFAWLLKALSVTFHFSMLIALAAQGLFSASQVTIGKALTFLTIILGGVVMAYRNRDIFASMMHFHAPSWLSGLVPVAIMSVALAGYCLSPAHRQDKFHVCLAGIGLVVFGIGVTQVTYLGLRILNIFAISLPLFLIDKFQTGRRPVGRRFLVALLLCGTLGAVGMYRNFVADYGGQRTGAITPFLPHRWIFTDVFTPFNP